LWNGQCLEVNDYITFRSFPQETTIKFENILLLFFMTGENMPII